jgi:hypothetical protein
MKPTLIVETNIFSIYILHKPTRGLRCLECGRLLAPKASFSTGRRKGDLCLKCSTFFRGLIGSLIRQGLREVYDELGIVGACYKGPNGKIYHDKHRLKTPYWVQEGLSFGTSIVKRSCHELLAKSNSFGEEQK